MRADSNQVKNRALFTWPSASISPHWMGQLSGAATGSSGCPFRSITRALRVIGNASLSAAAVNVIADTPPSVATGEVFPFFVRGRVTFWDHAIEMLDG
jgi:hypothetical protein